MSSLQIHDLERGFTTASADEVETLSHANTPSASPQPDTPVSNSNSTESHHHDDSKVQVENRCAGDEGQALLLAFNVGMSEEVAAILVQVDRPSICWARDMANREIANDKELPVDAPEEKRFDVERWWEFRNLYKGEPEPEIWKRIKQQYIAQQPSWYPYLPFWRPALLEERNILLHSRDGVKYRAEIEPALDYLKEQQHANNETDKAHKKLPWEPDESLCVGKFDPFGMWITERHEMPCPKGIQIDEYRVHGCYYETFRVWQSKRNLMRRKHDFIDCFRDPSKAETVFPLTTGHILDSSIHDLSDLRSIVKHELPCRDHPNREPPRINGLFVEYRFTNTQNEFEIMASLLFVGAVVLVWKLATGDWNVAAAFGSLFVALMTLGHQRSQASTKAKHDTTSTGKQHLE